MLAEFGQLAGTEQHLRRLLSERELREQQFRHDAMHDPLTGLPNRALFMKRLSDATQRQRRGEDGLFGVLFLDLDGFKLVNDSMGHHVGDQLLVTVARRLEECVRGGDIVARLGGDEFAILLERIGDARDSAMVAERVQRALAEPVNIGGYEHATSASIGVALSSGAAEQPEYVLRSADIAMYRAKNAGRGRYEMFDRAMHAEALTRLQIESDLRHAFDRNEFFLQYQPIISLRDGHVTGVEALVRWRHFERGVVSPATFVAVAEDTGLVVPLGRWVLRQACQQGWEWYKRFENGRPFTVSVNLSVREFGQPDLVRVVASILEETGLPASRLKLEITESAIIGQKHPAIETVEELRKLGVGIHLDDFGTGYSALSFLHRIPLDAVKVDRAFTNAIDSEERPMQVVRAIVSLAHAIGLEVIAEGVATEAQLELLRNMNCDLAQGFFFARPTSAEEIGAWLAEPRNWLEAARAGV
jgi:diguanylate cyclase (GGDEF)-like protein